MQVTSAAREDCVYMTTGGPLPFPQRSLGKYGTNSCCCPQLCPYSWGPSVGLPIALLSLQHSVPSHKGQEPQVRQHMAVTCDRCLLHRDMRQVRSLLMAPPSSNQFQDQPGTVGEMYLLC